MMKPYLPGLALSMSLLVAPPTWADQVDTWVQETDARTVDQRPAVEQERIYPMGALRKISGQLRMDAQINARGQVSSVTYELPPERAARDAFAAAREHLQTPGSQLLFWCEARDCGESSLWANEVFGNARLLGSDDQQAFFLLRRAAPAENTLLGVYTVTRGNRRVAMHVEQFMADAPLGELLPTAATLLRELRSGARLDYPSMPAVPSPAWVSLLGRALNLDSSLRVTVAGQGAAAWHAALIGSGVRETRLELGADASPGLHLQLIR
jgi:hypothetical protein